ncbi:MAG: hypothetical protein JW852_07670, partial [Spirochaetales bacterium]|nr:hypothetical protein [Spirochaetales bacterium]
VLFGLALVVGILTFTLLRTGRKKNEERKTGKKPSAQERPVRPCPLCGSLLVKGETVKTIVYPSTGDTLAEVYGCPYCYGVNATAVRICPVCKKPVPDGGYVIGRMFKEGRHLHVLGCTRCRKLR